MAWMMGKFDIRFCVGIVVFWRKNNKDGNQVFQTRGCFRNSVTVIC